MTWSNVVNRLLPSGNIFENYYYWDNQTTEKVLAVNGSFIYIYKLHKCSTDQRQNDWNPIHQKLSEKIQNYIQFL
jgi:hypothetical protein